MDGDGDSILLTTSCTTGWADWVHGELWLCPDGLLRLSLGLAKTIFKSSSPGAAVAFDRAERKSGVRRFDQAQISELVSRKRSIAWVPWVNMRDASLRCGLLTGRLSMTLADGRSVKFLWLRDRRVFDVLRAKLLERLGPSAVRLA